MSTLHEDLIVIDGLIVSNWSAEVFGDMRKGGLTAANCTCCVWEGFAETMDNIARWNGWFRDHDDLIVKARTAADIRRGQGRRTHRDHPRLPEHVRLRGQTGRGPALQGRGRRHRAAHLQHPELRRLRLLREQRFRPQRLGPRTGGRDEPGGDAHRPQPRGLPHLGGDDPRIRQAGCLHALPAVPPSSRTPATRATGSSASSPIKAA